MSIVGGQPNPDAVILFQGTTPAVPALPYIGNPIDTNGSSSVVWEVTGNTSFIMTIEGSNDQNFWSILWVLPLSEVSQLDNITGSGYYSLDATTRYIRFNIISSDDVLTHTVYGRDSAPASAAGRLSVALDQTSNVSMSVSVVNLKKDATGALIESDAVGPFIVELINTQSQVVYDTTGYNNIVVQQIGGGSTAVAISNDGLNWLGVQGVQLQNGSIATSLSASNIYSFACAARYIRFTGTATAAQLVSYFRTTDDPAVIDTVNFAELNGTQVAGGGQVGSLGIGGAAAVNTSGTLNPVIMGGDDNVNVHRRLFVVNPASKTSMGGITTPSNLGILVTGGLDQANNTQIKTFVSGGYQNVPLTPILDLSQHEGQTVVQLLAQILIELQINNHYLHQLPLLLNNSIANPDEPSALRQEPSLFNQ